MRAEARSCRHCQWLSSSGEAAEPNGSAASLNTRSSHPHDASRFPIGAPNGCRCRHCTARWHRWVLSRSPMPARRGGRTPGASRAVLPAQAPKPEPPSARLPLQPTCTPPCWRCPPWSNHNGARPARPWRRGRRTAVPGPRRSCRRSCWRCPPSNNHSFGRGTALRSGSARSRSTKAAISVSLGIPPACLRPGPLGAASPDSAVGINLAFRRCPLDRFRRRSIRATVPASGNPARPDDPGARPLPPQRRL